MEVWMWAAVSAIAAITVSGAVFGPVFYKVGYKRRQEKAESAIGSAE